MSVKDIGVMGSASGIAGLSTANTTFRFGQARRVMKG